MPTLDIDNYEAILDAAPIDRLSALITEEARALAAILPEAHALQWLATPRERQPSAGRSGNDGPSNPTADITLDAGRLALRAQVIRSERLLRESVIALRGVRLGLQKALDRAEE